MPILLNYLFKRQHNKKNKWKLINANTSNIETIGFAIISNGMHTTATVIHVHIIEFSRIYSMFNSFDCLFKLVIIQCKSIYGENFIRIHSKFNL